MVNVIAILGGVDYCFCFQAMAFVDCLDLYTNLIIFLNGKVISSLASLNSNYDGRQRGKRLFKCTRSAFPYVHVCVCVSVSDMEKQSFALCLKGFTSHLSHS